MTTTTAITPPQRNAYQQWTPLHDCIEQLLKRYFSELDGHDPANLHNLVLEAVEPPLLNSVMQHCKNNQTRAALMLGVSRMTLRKKLKQYNLLKP